VSDGIELLDGSAQCARRTSAVKDTRNEQLSERQFDQVVERLIYVATADNTLPSDALGALAKALGTLCSFIARREGLSLEEVLGACQDTVSIFARAADVYMSGNADVAPSKS
jgi:hypothetical protein